MALIQVLSKHGIYYDGKRHPQGAKLEVENIAVFHFQNAVAVIGPPEFLKSLNEESKTEAPPEEETKKGKAKK